MESDTIFRHLQKRGVLTSYWVLNDDDEIKEILKRSPVDGVMTDRPAYVKNLL